jgi:hypothetical protein
MDITRASNVDQEVALAIGDLFAYRSLDEDQKNRGEQVRAALAHALTVIIENVPPCPDRSVAIRKLREVRMDCLSAISFRGKY